jgi:hypothetical protein
VIAGVLMVKSGKLSVPEKLEQCHEVNCVEEEVDRQNQGKGFSSA